MASIAMMIGGAVLNAAAFTGGNYLAKFLAGDNGKAALDKKTRHDKALEAYQSGMAKYSRERTQLLDWINTNEEIKEHAQKNLHKHRLRVQAIQPGPPRPETDSAQSAEFLGHVPAKRAAETGGASFCRRRRARGCISGFSFPLNFFCRSNNGCQTRQNLQQPPGVLEGRLCDKKIGRSRQSARKCYQTVALQTGHLADLFACTAIRSSPEI